MNIDKITDKKLEKKLIKIKNNLKALVASKIRLFIEKKSMVKKYNKIIKITIEKANKVNFKGIVPSREKKFLKMRKI